MCKIAAADPSVEGPTGQDMDLDASRFLTNDRLEILDSEAGCSMDLVQELEMEDGDAIDDVGDLQVKDGPYIQKLDFRGDRFY